MKFAELKTKKDRTSFIRQKLATDLAWQLRGLVAIYKMQTLDEQAIMTTKHTNGVGFNFNDAEILSIFARRVQDNLPLSQKQLDIIKRRMPKYAGQLESLAKANQVSK